MYLTRMHLNPARRGTRSLLGSPQRMHAAVLCSFPPTNTEGKGRVLWRVDGEAHELMLYVSSPTRPDLTHLVEQAGWPTAPDPWQTASLDPLFDRLASGQHWAFRLTANPVRSVLEPGKSRGKRYAHVTVAQQLDWLASRSSGWGFSISDTARPTAEVIARRTVSFDRRSDGHRRQVTVATATFQGTLEVTDAPALAEAMREGMGRAKGYGCGLLTLAPRT